LLAADSVLLRTLRLLHGSRRKIELREARAEKARQGSRRSAEARQ
jgi:hypothetical protein